MENDSYFVKVYDFRESHVKSFKEALSAFSWHHFYNFDCTIESKCEIFYEILKGALSNIPSHMVKMNGREKPWITPKLKMMINLRYDAYRRGNFPLYHHYRNKVKKEIILSKKAWITKLKERPNAIWKVLNEAKKYSLNCKLTDVNSLEALNKIFAENFSTSPDWPHLFQIVNESSDHSMAVQRSWDIDISVEKTKTLLQRLKTSKAAGSDDFPPLLAKAASEELAGPLTHLIALSIRTHKVPGFWKFANVTPLPKCKNPTLRDFRPISVLSVFSKILEQYVSESLKSAFVDSYGRHQFGFRPQHSTLHANIRIHDFITSNMDDVKISGVVLITFDMAKAFDKLSHLHLIQSLLNACLPTEFVLWCCDFLRNRHQCVKIGSLYSSSVSVTSGVPQGGKLSPFLFCIHMSSLFPFHSCAMISKYADDVVIVLPLTSLNFVDEKIKAEIDQVKNWCDTHGLVLNDNKTKCMLFKRKSQIVIPTNVCFYEHLKILGVIFSSDLSWDAFVTDLRKRAVQRLYVIKRLKKCLTRDELLLVYNATVLSVLEYNAPLIVGLNSKNCEKLEKVRRRCHRVICGPDCRCDRFTPLSIRREYLALKTFYKIRRSNNLLFNLIPPSLSRSRRTHSFVVPFTRTLFRHSSFIPFCTLLHNNSCK